LKLHLETTNLLIQIGDEFVLAFTSSIASTVREEVCQALQSPLLPGVYL